MSAFNYKNILLKGDPIRKEAPATAIIIPGMLVEGVAGFAPHSTAGGNARRLFAQENDMVGNTIDTPYAIDDTVQANSQRQGDEVFALLQDGQSVAVGDPLESAGDGTLRALAAVLPGTIVAWALEAVTAAGQNERICVEAN